MSAGLKPSADRFWLQPFVTRLMDWRSVLASENQPLRGLRKFPFMFDEMRPAGGATLAVFESRGPWRPWLEALGHFTGR